MEERLIDERLNNVHSIRLLIVDRVSLLRSSLSRFLASQPGFEVVGEFGSAADALAQIANGRVDVVLLELEDCASPDGGFMVAASKAGYQGRFLPVAGAMEARKIATALKNGAAGVFLKSDQPERLVGAIQRVAQGEVWVDEGVLRYLASQLLDCLQPASDHAGRPLEDRERSVLLGIVDGLTNRKIGVSMGLSESSVKNIVQRLFGKAGVKTRSQLVRAAMEGSSDLRLASHQEEHPSPTVQETPSSHQPPSRVS